jgi:hypothetical protein
VYKEVFAAAAVPARLAGTQLVAAMRYNQSGKPSESSFYQAAGDHAPNSAANDVPAAV